MVLLKRQSISKPSTSTLNVGYGEDWNEDYYGSSSTSRNGHNKMSTHTPSQEGMQFQFAKSSTSFKECDEMTSSALPRASNILLLVIIGVLCNFQYSNNHAIKTSASELTMIMADFDNVRDTIEDTEYEIDTAHDSFHQLKVGTLASHAEDHDDYDDDEYYYYDILTEDERKNIASEIIERHDKQTKDIHNLKKAIQDFHKQELMRRFGKGPYHVEFEINNNGTRDFFTLETAPNDFMPHSVYTFMDMVEKKVWDNSVFIHKWNHIVQAAPISPDGENRRESIDGFLSFPEYSDAYKHDQYTVGFSGRPGGPEFYINLIDNEESHGPGRQEHSTVLNDADPCFAKIIIGREAVDRLRKTSLEAINSGDENGIAFSSIEVVKQVARRAKRSPPKVSYDARSQYRKR